MTFPMPPIKAAQLFSLVDVEPDANAKLAAPAADRPSRIQWDDKPKSQPASDDPGRPSNWSKLVVCLNVACLTATVSISAMIAASFQPWRSLQTMSEKITAMEKAEDRLRADIVNAASRIDGIVQLRLDRSDSAQFQIMQGLGALRTSVEHTVETVRDGGSRVDDRLSAMLVSIAELTLPAAALHPAPAEGRRSGPKTVAALPPSFEDMTGAIPTPKSSPLPDGDGSMMFERREMPDGSVAYRRVD
ncbi:hypothetical protein [Fulvimarina sp. 2208YS6-2-32]|nr:hypothetical protein [Fulvimarina sp. 2208YS6-2-32]